MGEADLAQTGAAELLRELTAGERSSSKLTEACITQIESGAASCLNAISQPLFDSAREQARAADETLAKCRRTGEAPPALCGLPITIKDCFDIEGTAATLGIDSRTGQLATADSPLVARLRAAGAVILGKTNVPQVMLLHSCDNPVHGRTLHPTDPLRGPGGSSGGEAAVVAAGGSTLGLASDLGGSIRQPAHACGLAGLKPTSGRLTNVGSHRGLAGMQAVAIQPGPIAQRVEDLDLAMRTLVGQPKDQQLDETQRPWHNYRAVDVGKLNIAYWETDGWFDSAPAMQRAVRESAAVLNKRGAKLAQIDSSAIAHLQIDRAMQLYFGLVSADGLKSIRGMLKGSRIDWQLRRQLWFAGWPQLLRGPVSLALRLFGQKWLANLLPMTGPRSAREYWKLTAEANAYVTRFWEQLDRQCGRPVDALLMPPHALPALPHGTALDLLPAASYCYLPNLLGTPAGVVPWTTVRDNEQAYPTGSGIDLVTHFARRAMDRSAGLPVGVQVVARPWREDVVLAVMEALERGTAP